MKIYSKLRWTYNKTIRSYLPKKVGVYNSVAIRTPRLFDRHDVFPEYKAGTVSQVRDAVMRGDRVVEAGTGSGVCAVCAARNTGPTGSILSHEGAIEQIETARETTELNGVENLVEIRHALIGPEIELYGNADNASRIPFKELPSCDVFISDVEGAESSFVSEIETISPREAVVETHGHHNSPTNEIVSELKDQGYCVESIIPAMENETDKDNMTVRAKKK
jgi:tRNA A58 N-methylase Trm61